MPLPTHIELLGLPYLAACDGIGEQPKTRIFQPVILGLMAWVSQNFGLEPEWNWKGFCLGWESAGFYGCIVEKWIRAPL